MSTQQNTSTSPEKKLSSGKITLILFWLGFTFFLAVSVPHVAWLFHEFEPLDSFSILWWVVSYGVAVSIDVLILWLSYVQTTDKKSDVVISWIFILTLACLSWYANWLYDMFHNPVSHVDVWSISLLFNLTTVGTLTPIIVSAIPVFIIGYTFMLSKMSNTTSESLEEKATRLEREKVLRERIKQAKQGSFSSRIKEGISSVGDIASHAGYVVTHIKPSTSLSEGQETVPASPEENIPEGTPETVPASPEMSASTLERVVTTEILEVVTPETVPATNGHKTFKNIEDILKEINS